MKNQKIRIILKSFNHYLIVKSAEKIIKILKNIGANFTGPIPLPTYKERYTILISPHVDKDARDQYEIRTHKRIIDIINPSVDIIDVLMKLNIIFGVYIKTKFFKR